MNTKIWILLLFAFQLCLVNLGVAQTTYYVSNSGNDSNDGLSWATAKATINGAMGLITAPNNDSVFVAVGTYPACTIQNGTHVGHFETESSTRGIYIRIVGLLHKALTFLAFTACAQVHCIALR